MKPRMLPFLLVFWIGVVAFVLGVLKGLEGSADLALAAAVLLTGDVLAISIVWRDKIEGKAEAPE